METSKERKAPHKLITESRQFRNIGACVVVIGNVFRMHKLAVTAEKRSISSAVLWLYKIL